MVRTHFALFCAIALEALAQTAAPSPAAPSPPAKIADVAWLQGFWVGEGMGGYSEEFWSPPRAGAMLRPSP